MIHPSRSHRIPLKVLLALVFALPSFSTPASAQPTDQAVDSAVYLLRATMVPDRQGQFNALIRSLRQINDPELKPIFKALSESENPIMKIHGILGLAECDPKKKLDLTLLAEIKDARIQQELRQLAMDSDLLDIPTAKQLLGWPALEVDAKMVIATHLIGKGEFSDVALLKKGLEGNFPLRKAVAGLLLTQLGDPAGPPELDVVDKSQERVRDDIRALMLQTAFRFKLDKCAPWAAKIAAEPNVNEKLCLLAMRTAMRFGNKSAAATWAQKYASETDAADRVRLALSILNMSEWLEPEIHAPLIASDDPFTKALGEAGRAVSSKKNVGPALVNLLSHGHSLANTWTLAYAHQYASEEDRRLVLTTAFEAYAKATDATRAQRLDEAVTALTLLYDKDPVAAEKIIGPILRDPKVDLPLLQGVLFSMVRTTKGTPAKLLEGLDKPYDDNRANSLKLMLMAKHGMNMTPAQLKDLSLMVRGGGGVPDTLRIQAAWAYLKVTKQTQAALVKATEQ